MGERRADIQGLRAIAVLAVVIFHAGLPLPGGFSGVDVFFVISGFVIVALLVRQYMAHGRLFLGEFYGRRFRRLMPALAMMVAIVTVLGMALLSPLGPQQTLAWTALGSVLLTANVAIAATTGGYFDQAAASNPLLNTWSLSVEEQFYLAFPVLLFLAFLMGRRRQDRSKSGELPKATMVFVVLLTTGSFVLAVAANDLMWLSGSELLTGFYSPVARAWEFGLGALLAIAMARGYALPSSLRTPASLIGAGLIIFGFLILDEELRYPGLWTLLPTVGAVLVIAAMSHGPVGWFLTRPPLVRMGDWSYSIYLWHWPVIVFAVLLRPELPWMALLAALASLVPAIGSYYMLENPLRRRRWGGRSRGLTLAGVFVVVPALLAGILMFGANQTWGQPLAQAVAAKPAVEHRGFLDCMTFTSMGGKPAMRPELCTFNGAARGAPVYLVGDSNAAHLSEAVIDAGVFLQRPVRIATAAGCPFMDVHRGSQIYDPQADAACRAYYVRTLKELATAEQGVAVIGQSVGYWTDPTLALALDEMPEDSTEGPSFEGATEGLARAVLDLVRAGHKVIVVKPMLTFVTDGQNVSYDQCPALELLLDTCPFAVNVSEAAPQQVLARDTIDAVAARTGSYVIDLIDRQCPEGVCRATANGLPVYSDSTHYSPEFAASLAGLFAEAINSVSK